MSHNVQYYLVACRSSITRLESWLFQASAKAGTEQDLVHLSQLAEDLRYYQNLLNQNELSLSDLRLVYIDLLDLYLWAVNDFSTVLNLRAQQERPWSLPLSLTEAA